MASPQGVPAFGRGPLAAGLQRDVPKLGPLEHEMPTHPVDAGAAFDITGLDTALAELQRWLSNAHHTLERFVRGDKQASPVRLWPHYFDIASLMTLGDSEDPEQARSVNVGLSPGDDSYGRLLLRPSSRPAPCSPTAPVNRPSAWRRSWPGERHLAHAARPRTRSSR